MIGIVVVSHSRRLAVAAVGLASEMVDATELPRIAVAAGLDETTFGTDAAAVAEAVVEVESPDGVLVLVDLGSAVMSAEMALEFLEPDLADRVVISSAPLVEGLVAAVILAASGADLPAVVVEAQDGLSAKQSHLQARDESAGGRDAGSVAAPDPAPETAQQAPDAPQSASDDATATATAEIVISVPHGLHARPAAKVVSLVRRFDASVTLARVAEGATGSSAEPGLRSTPCDAASLSSVATLGARQGDRLLVRASGPDARAAVEAITDLAARDFGEISATASREVTQAALSRGAAERTGRGSGAPSVGARGRAKSGTGVTGQRKVVPFGSGLDIALGPAVVLNLQVDVTDYKPGDVAAEVRRSALAVAAVEGELTTLRDETARDMGAAEAEIFDAHQAMVNDPDLQAFVAQDLAAGRSAVDAWSQRLSEVADRFEALDDAYQRARAQDVRSVQRRLLLELLVAGGNDRLPIDTSTEPVITADWAGRLGRRSPPAEGTQGGADGTQGGAAGTQGGAVGSGILVLPELDAATAATIDVEQVLGIVTRQGGATGHGFIVAKSRGIPILTDAGERLDAVHPGSMVGFDARTGELWVDPADDDAQGIRNEIESRSRFREQAFTQAREPARMRDGCRIVVAANVTSVDDAAAALVAGADGSGLVRTEVLFGARSVSPSVEEQAQEFLALASALSGKPITIRTWDVGGDKPLRFLPQPREANPFLGERGLRLFRRQPRVLVEQLRAVCRAAQETPVKVMFPMVSSSAEVRWALDRLAEAASEEGGMAASLKVGVMVEVPAAALAARLIAADLDFVSIGTNDLTQYTMAAERGNAAVSHLAKAYDPAVLRLVGLVCEEVPATVEVAVCGDLASDPAGAILLAGLGVREVSVVAPAVPEVKAALRRMSLSDAEVFSQRALEASGPDEVSALLQSLTE